ncbi:c-type cytochrome [Rhodopirellula sp. JC740]|uniref:C-type cytochrome n=1 Tax=Rhodopirellula halodulae TaxID=2894198 RepID=A0ABS8NIL7_9BACT|nr:c-type cytochrome [Rhodopirellula sp. JC740]MCC9642643.1 c-type cytochrome [Rhodopirellula sp. JC740]
MARKSSLFGRHWHRWLFALGCVVVFAGCSDGTLEFTPNQVHALATERSRDMPTQAALDDVTVVLNKLFGTPEEPRWPADLLENEQQLVSLKRLQQASGSVESDEENVHRGLYTEHCVICHGVSGSGTGPASMYQWPYPRDFRAGVFKWKSTERDAKPTREDLRALLQHGIPGSPMPSFATVSADDRESLIDYLVYLSVRGELERKLIALAVDEMDYGDEAPEQDWRLSITDSEEKSEGEQAVIDTLREVAGDWVAASQTSVPPEPIPGAADELHASIARGAALFGGQVANCAGCHGPQGQGGMVLNDFDDWTKEFTTRVGITPTDSDAVKPFRKAGALPPRTIEPRRLAGGVLRGGDDAETIFRRIQHGIAGTPMPGIELSEQAAGTTGLSPADVWDLVHYVQSLVRPTPKPTAHAEEENSLAAIPEIGATL